MHQSSVLARLARLLWLLLAARQAAMAAGSAGNSRNHDRVAGLLAALDRSQDLAAGPKIYIYPPPAPAANPYHHIDCYAVPNTKSTTGHLATRLDPYRWEHLLPQHLSALPTHVTDPATADLYFIPTNATCYTKHEAELHLPPNPSWDQMSEQFGVAYLSVLRTYVEPYLQQVRQAPHFRRRNGADHAIAVAEEHGPCRFPFVRWAGFVALLGDVVVLTMNGLDERNPAAATNIFWPSQFGCFTPEHDIVVPPFVPHTHSFSASDSPGRPQAAPTRAARPTLAYFGGSMPDHKNRSSHPSNPSPEYGSGTRSMLILMTYDAHNAAGQRLLVHTPNPPASVRLAAMNGSLFCLCLCGNAVWSTRPYDCLGAGSLPVHLTDGFSLPFERYIPYRSMSVKLAQSSMAFLVRLLEGFVQAPGGGGGAGPACGDGL